MKDEDLTFDSLIDESKVAKKCSISVKTLQNRRSLGQPPRYFKVGGKTVRYKLSDVLDWLEEGRVEPRVPD